MALNTFSHRRKLIIDVDTGIDDAHAIMLALSSPAIDVVAITCVSGNVSIDNVTANTLKVLQVCERLDVPVYKGAVHSLLGKVSEFGNLSKSPWSDPVDMNILQSEHATSALIRLVNQFPGEITLVALAPLTNIVLAFHLDPEFPRKLHSIVIMGGNINARGRVSPCAEFNFFTDPEAAYVVLARMGNIQLLPYEVCCHSNLSWEFLEEWSSRGTPKANFIRDTFEFDLKMMKESCQKSFFKSCDGYAMAAVIDPSIVTEEEKVYATVELMGQLTRGQMVTDWSGVLKKEKNVSVILGLDLSKIQQLFMNMTL